MYKIDYGTYVGNGSGCGLSDDGNGWVSTPYTRAITDCLMDDGYINKNIIDPSGCSTAGHFHHAPRPPRVLT